MKWRSVEDDPPTLAQGRSKNVLVWDGTVLRIAYAVQLDGFPIEWRLQGRDGYAAEPTLWQELPERPSDA